MAKQQLKHLIIIVIAKIGANVKVNCISCKEVEFQKAQDALEAMAKRRQISVEELIADARANACHPTPTQSRILLLAERMERNG